MNHIFSYLTNKLLYLLYIPVNDDRLIARNEISSGFCPAAISLHKTHSARYTITFTIVRHSFCAFREVVEDPKESSIGNRIANENKQGRWLIAQNESVLIKRYLKNALLNGTWLGSSLWWRQRGPFENTSDLRGQTNLIIWQSGGGAIITTVIIASKDFKSVVVSMTGRLGKIFGRFPVSTRSTIRRKRNDRSCNRMSFTDNSGFLNYVHYFARNFHQNLPRTEIRFVRY
jgi:hypothetical protein